MCKVGFALLMLGLTAGSAMGQSAPAPADKNESLPVGAVMRMGSSRWRSGLVLTQASALRPDGRAVFVSGSDRIHVVDLETGLTLRTIKGPAPDITALAVSPDGKILASASYQHTLLWDAETGKQLRALKVKSVVIMAFSADGKKLITGGNQHEHSVRMFDVATGKEELRLLRHEDTVTYVGISPDNRTLVSASSDNSVRVTDLTTGEARYVLGHARDAVVALSPDGKTMAIADARYQPKKKPTTAYILRVIDVATGKTRATIDLGQLQGPLTAGAVVFTPDNQSLVYVGPKLCHVYDVATGKRTRELSDVHGRYFTKDGRLFVAAGTVIRVWDFASGRELHPPEGPLASAESLAIAPDGATIATSSLFARKLIFLWDVKTGKFKGTLSGHDSHIRGVTFAPDGRLVSGGGDSTVRIWDVAKGKEAAHFDLHDPSKGEKRLRVVTMQIAQDGKTLAAAAASFEQFPRKEAIHLFAWDLASGKLISKREQIGYPFDFPGFSADADAFLTRHNEGLVLKGLSDGKERLRLQPVPQPKGEGVLNADVLESPFTFSPDGRFVVASSSRQCNEGPRYWRDQYAFVVFDLGTGKELHRIASDDWRMHAAISADSKRIAAASASGARIWDAGSGKRLWESPPLDARVTALAFSPDGIRLATALADTTILLWNVGLPMNARRK